jgi:A/G-specific adenine glycosylase
MCENGRHMRNSLEQTRLRQQLLAWFRQFQRDLPWRRTKDAYRIWVSEIMLQQTRVAAVIPYYERFLERFPDVRALAEAPQEEVLRMWSGLGYYSRARNLQRAAQRIVAKHGGEFPRKPEDVLALPGVGAYTGAAVLSIAFGEKLAVLDGNVRRVLARLDAIRGDLREAKQWRGLQQTADALLDRDEPGNWNQAMMELGATVCTPSSPQCLLCPAAEFCEARKLGLAEQLPEKRKKRETVEVSLAAAVFIDLKARTLVLPPPKRTSDRDGVGETDHVPALVSRLWHFPTIVASENPEMQLLRSLQDMVGGGITMFEMVALEVVRHAVTYREIRISPFGIPCMKLPKVAGAKVVPLGDLRSLPVSSLTRKVAASALAAAKHKRPDAHKGQGSGQADLPAAD